MEYSLYAPGTVALRDKLQDTWLHDLVVQYQAIRRRVMRRSEGEAFLLRRYFRIHGKPLNLTNPPDLYREAVLAHGDLESGRYGLQIPTAGR